MKATSSAQFEATASGSVPPLEQVRPNVWAVPLAMPNPALPYVLSYFVVDANGLVHVIDAGWESDENWQRVLDALATIGSSPEQVASVTLTHLHRDHVSMTPRYQRSTPARVQLGRVEQLALRTLAADVDDLLRPPVPPTWGVPADRAAELEVGFNTEGDHVPIEADVLLDDGDDLGVPGVGIRVVATPGHTNGSICLVFDEPRLIATGDHLLPAIFAGLGLGGPIETNPVSDYVSSLARLQPYDEFEALPGHGYRFTGIAERRAESAEHHDSRTRDAAAILAADPSATVWQIASRLHWTAGWQNLEGPYLRSALAQTAWHRERALAR